jgi:cell volume regulation protein A
VILPEQLLILTALFLVLSIVASKVAARSGIPILLLFLGLGMLAGSDGPGGIFFDNPWLAQTVGVIALVLILFSGGLDTQLSDVRAVLRPGLSLATLGVLVTACSVGVFMHLIFGFTLYEGILLGAIISSTDAAAVLTLLRGRGIHLKARLKPLLELESGSNDPMAVFLTIGMIQLIQSPATSPLVLLPLFVVQMSLGALAGVIIGRGGAWLINRLRLEYEGLYPVVTVAAALLAYSATALIGGNGFLAVYLAGLLIGDRKIIHRNSLRRFHDGLAWLAQIAMFLTLGLQVYPSRLPPVIQEGLLVALFLIFVARPLSVSVALLASRRLNWRKRLFVAWVGLRGAAPIILATFPLLAGLQRADEIFHLVFFIVISSVVIQGMSLGWVARLLRVDAPAPPPTSSLAKALEDETLTDNILELTVQPSCGVVGKQLLDLKLPRGVLIVLIGRGRETIIPNGGTLLEAGDLVLLVAHAEERAKVEALFS